MVAYFAKTLDQLKTGPFEKSMQKLKAEYDDFNEALALMNDMCDYNPEELKTRGHKLLLRCRMTKCEAVCMRCIRCLGGQSSSGIATSCG